MDINTIQRAAKILRAGGIVAYPTEAVYGLGCDPQNDDALRRLLKIKQRDPDKGLILIGADFAQLAPWLAAINPTLRDKALARWPGPVTWLWPARNTVSSLLRGKHTTLAVRIIAHSLAAQLCTVFGGALVSTSANRSGQAAARTPDEVRRIFGEEIDFIIEGETGGLAAPSEIRDVITGTLVRKGGDTSD